jgi:hypothetical protein
MVDVLNRAGRNVAFRASQFTPAATVGKIRSDLNRDPHLKYALTSLALKKKGIGILPSPQFAKEVEKFVARRVASRAFLRSGWSAAIEALGGVYRGRNPGKGHGYATKASVYRFLTEIANTVPGIEKIGVAALKKAIDYVSQDMIDYANSLMVKRANAHSAGR